MKIIPKTAVILLLIILTFGCAKKMIINIDGMPVSNYEYNLTNEETGIRAVFVLARYYREYEGKEYIVKPEYLNALQVNRIDSTTTERLILHIKVINLKKQYFAMNWEISEPGGGATKGRWYTGKLSRKDFSIDLPLFAPGDYDFLFSLSDEDGDDLFSLPLMGYRVKGGAPPQSDQK